MRTTTCSGRHPACRCWSEPPCRAVRPASGFADASKMSRPRGTRLTRLRSAAPRGHANPTDKRPRPSPWRRPCLRDQKRESTRASFTEPRWKRGRKSTACARQRTKLTATPFTMARMPSAAPRDIRGADTDTRPPVAITTNALIADTQRCTTVKRGAFTLTASASARASTGEDHASRASPCTSHRHSHRWCRHGPLCLAGSV